MVCVTTGHEHSFISKFNVVCTNWARWALQLPVISFLAMLILYFHHWQLINCLFVSWLRMILFLLCAHLLDEVSDIVEEIRAVLIVLMV